MPTQSTPPHKTLLFVVAAAMLVWGLFGVIDVRNRTFTGFRTDGNNTVTQVIDGSPASAAGFESGDRIRVDGGIAVEDTRAIAVRVRPSVGEVRTFELERDGRELNLELSFATLPTDEVLTAYGAILMGLSFLVFGVWAYLTAPSGKTALLALLGLAFAPALMVGPYFASPLLRNVVITVVLLVELLAFAFLLHFLIAFPKREQPFGQKKLLGALYGPAAAMGLVVLWATVFQPDGTSLFNTVFRTLFGLFIVGYFGLSLIAIVRGYFKTTSADRSKKGMNLLLAGAAIGLGPITLGVIVSLIAPQLVIPGVQYSILTLALLPVTFALAAVRAERIGVPTT